MKRAIVVIALVALFSGVFFRAAKAQKSVTFSATINPGVLITDIRDKFGLSIPNPNVDLGKVINSRSCRYGNDALSAAFGTEIQRIYVDNPKAALDGWSLTMAPVIKPQSTGWHGQKGEFLDYDDYGHDGLGCSDSDGDGAGGLLSVDSSKAQLRTDCQTCTPSNMFIGSGSQTFSDSSSLTLIKANSQSDYVGSWYVTGIKINQTVPALQPGDEYSIQFSLTVTAT